MECEDEKLLRNIYVAEPERGLGGLKDLVVKAEWYKVDYPFHDSDTLVRPFLNLPRVSGWLKRVRTAYFLSMETVAAKLGMSRWNYSRFEANEEKMSLANLRRCAEAMDCELIYAIVPKERTPYSQRVWRQLQDDGPPSLYWLRTRQYFPGYRKLHGWRKNYCTVDPHTRQQYWTWKTGGRKPLPRRNRR